MHKRFLNLFNLTEEEAIKVLDTPPDRIGEMILAILQPLIWLAFPPNGRSRL